MWELCDTFINCESQWTYLAKVPWYLPAREDMEETLLNEKTLKKLPEIVSLLQLGLGKGKYGIIASSKRIS